MRVPGGGGGGGGGCACAAELPRWSRTPPPPPTAYPHAEQRHSHVVFAHDDALNGRLALWQGDLASLEADVLAVTTNESLTESSAVNERVFAAAGPGLKEEIFLDGKECRTGEVCVTSAHQLAARRIIHTVGPKYTAKYHTAAENTLHHCYRNVLYKAQELGARSLALCPLHSLKRNFPPDLGAHIALRTIRRFLERHPSPGVVVLVCREGAEYALMEALCPLYFPRSPAEAEAARRRLPADTGGRAGEPHVPSDRHIRITHNPHRERGVVVLVFREGAEYALMKALCPLYFPRSPAEAEAARRRLPADTGGRAGEPHVPSDRHIRITRNPHRERADDDASLTEEEAEAAAEAAAAFARVHASPDTQRLLAADAVYPPLQDVMRRRLEHQDRYDRLLRRARSEDLSEVSGIGCLYRSGVDRLGRPVVIFIGKWFPINDINLDKALLYLIQLLDPVVRGDYVIAYFHTQASVGNHPPFSWLKEVYTVLPYKYKKNLKAFYIVHPTFWTKMMTWWFTTFMAPAIKAKVHNLPGVEYLYSVMARDQLEVPAFITEYDMTINGLHYFQPDTSET